MINRLKEWAGTIKQDVMALYFASRDPRVPWYVKALAIVVAAYALSPIDLIPDFIPVLGYADDLILVPLGILLIIRLIPAKVMADNRERAAKEAARPTSPIAAAVIVTIWIVSIAAIAWLIYARI